VVVAVRDDVRRRCGGFCFPPPVSGQTKAGQDYPRPPRKVRGEEICFCRFCSMRPRALWLWADQGRLGGSAHGEGGCTACWSEEGLLPTQRCVGQGPAGAAGLVLREGVVAEVALEEPALAQLRP
jgi:hypothetical protein